MKKTLTLFKRGKKWYGKKIVDGKEYVVSTGETSKSAASQVAEYKLLTKLGIVHKTVHDSVHETVHDRVQICEKPQQKQETENVQSDSPTPRVIDVILHWTANALHVRSRTRAKVVSSHLRIYLRETRCNEHSNLSEAFSPEAFELFYQRRLAGKENKARQTAIRTANSHIKNVRSLFSRRFIDSYKFDLPASLTAWQSKPLPKAVDDTQYTVKDKIDTFKVIIKRCEKLKDSNPAAYLAYYLQLHCGLRRNEAACARWSWLTEDSLLVQSEDDFSTKSGRSREVPLSPDQVAHIRSFRKAVTVFSRVGKAQRVQPDDYIIPGGNPTARYAHACNAVAKIIRDAGLKGHKSCHELRKYFGANVATQLGLFAAQKYLGHAGPEITSKYYADLTEKKSVTIGILT
tara:strand:+ start:2699 stop:3907 length:1209 start_codon:yes stop_codon:yes gene_type:complete